MADSDSSLTPEQRLLKLIEEQESKEAETGKSETAAKGEKKGRPFEWGALLSPAYLKSQLIAMGAGFQTKIKSGQSQIQLKHVNRILKVAAFLVAVALVVNILYDLKLSNKDIVQELKMTQSKMVDLEPITDAKTVDRSVQTSEIRNLFQPVAARVESEKSVSALTVKLLEMTQNLKLTGISINPEDPSRTFCMIEDLEKNITIFSKQGDTISGMRIDEIRSDSVVLKYQNEVIEIR